MEKMRKTRNLQQTQRELGKLSGDGAVEDGGREEDGDANLGVPVLKVVLFKEWEH